MSTTTAEKHEFQAEISQLLDIVIHSLYTDKEIFIRELISNGADALEKLKFLQTSGQPVFQPDLPLQINISTDDTAKTITFTDTGVGMTHEELVANLGTIAHSGSKAFLQQLAENQKGEANLIGQFGVGFYSAFMVASHVSVYTRSAQAEGEGWHWHSDGRTGYEIEPAPDVARGTKIVLTLLPEQTQFAQARTAEGIIKRYSSFVPVPIELNGEKVNTVQAIWTRNKSEITDDEYKEFFHYIGHEGSDPLYRLHFNADAPLAIRALLFVPEKSFEKIAMNRIESEVNLYCRRILIQPKAKGLFPEWLRFLKGVVDSEDLPLNISRESMQDSSLMQKLNKVLTSRFLKFLEEQAKTDPVKFDTFFKEFGHCLKEGVIHDYTHRDALAKLLRFESSTTEKGKTSSLADYVSRMGTDQKDVYFILAPNREAAETSPYFEVFQARKLEVLFLYEPWDELVMDHLREFDGKKLLAAEKAELEIENTETAEGELDKDQARLLANFFKETLGDRVGEVRASKRLADSPAVAVESDRTMTTGMRRMMKAMKPEEMPDFGKQDLEINPRHPIMVRLNKLRETDAALAGKIGEQIWDGALVAAGLLEDPRTMLKRMNELLARLLE